jgi:hypothetical protein
MDIHIYEYDEIISKYPTIDKTDVYVVLSHKTKTEKSMSCCCTAGNIMETLQKWCMLLFCPCLCPCISMTYPFGFCIGCCEQEFINNKVIHTYTYKLDMDKIDVAIKNEIIEFYKL